MLDTNIILLSSSSNDNNVIKTKHIVRRVDNEILYDVASLKSMLVSRTIMTQRWAEGAAC
jgi:hypothetical protein